MPVSCPSCSNRNETGALYCRGCYLPLLGDRDDEMAPGSFERFHALADACEMVRARRCTELDFHAWLQGFTDDQRAREGGIRAVDIPFGLEDDFADEMEVGWSGVESCNRGLARLLDWQRDDHDLLEGLRLFWRGVCLVKEAMQINRSNATRPIWA